MRARTTACLSLIAATLLASAPLSHADGVKPGDLVAVCGDSITEQHMYSVFIEDYLLMCKPVDGVKTEQFGWGGETSWGFHEKINPFCLQYKPTVATTCYGMNDGGYRPIDDNTAKHYRESQLAILESFKKAGVHFVVLGSPGAVDTKTFRGDPKKAEMYNATLGSLRDIDKQIATEQGVAFADVHQAMIDAMAKAKAKYGDGYVFAGPDGVHPGQNGHLVMAYAFLKAMGFDGNIGTITVDLSANTATATDGHKVLGVDAGTVSVESTKYPFCFTGDPKSSDATSGVIEFCPFNQDLNRFMLVVKNPGAARVKVTFGPNSREYSADELAKGINLAADFLDNPFSKPFAEIHQKLRTKEGAETAADKNLVMSLGYDETNFPECAPAYEKMNTAVQDLMQSQADTALTLVKPVKYTIKIEAVK
jgi:lysophospholipase L1-like esterase